MEESRKKTIRTWIDSQRESLILDLIKLVDLESVSQPEPSKGKFAPFGEGCQKALHAMLERGSSMGLSSISYEDYLGSISLDGEERRKPSKVIGIWSHLDVVPAGEGWQYHPFESVYEDGLVIGRGAQDNKSAAVMGLYLLKGIKEMGISLRHPAALYLGCSEECGMQDLDYFLSHYQAPGVSLIADCGFPACYGEKGSMTVTIRTGRKSLLSNVEVEAGVAHNIIPGTAKIRFEISKEKYSLEAEGVSGHSAFPEGSVNALCVLLGKMMEFPMLPEEEKNTLRPLWKFTETTDGSVAGISKKDSLLGDLTCCGTMLTFEKGTWCLNLDIRYPNSAHPDEILRRITAIAEAQGCLAEQKSHLRAFSLTPENPIIRKLTEVYNQETKENTAAYSMAGGTYAAKLPRAIPFGIAFSDKNRITRKFPKGHGDYHQPDEAVIVDQILDALYIYMIGILELDRLLTEYEKNEVNIWETTV